ncbi:hypothetical protein ANCDUO_02013 [Ancylostoma duodenale]|uniref:Uncharacterized protein n=1 Tax=Ancylostoma duodenale TaxID=51022 RepID=A0A0C2DCR0_9BILA|nr:hypothetical protein ANCDUO_02013 [Ancylostoma duodenale]
MKTCSRRSDETLKAFESLKPKLQTLLVMWTEWETELLRLEDIAKDGIASRTNTMRDGGNPNDRVKIRRAGASAERIRSSGEQSAAGAASDEVPRLGRSPFSPAKRSRYQNCRSSYPLKCGFSRMAVARWRCTRLQR